MWPTVDRINASPLGGTLQFDYTIVSEGYFNSRQKQALRKLVEDSLETVHATATIQAITSPSRDEHYTFVKVRPSDSTVGPGSFLVLKTLQSALNPHLPYTAMGYWFVKATVPQGTYLLGLRFLGDPSPKEIRELKRRISRFDCVKRLDSSPFKKSSLHFALLIKGNPNESKEDAFRRDLKAAGSSLTVTPTMEPPRK